MSERDRRREKHTVDDLLDDLAGLGVQRGGVLLVQASLRSVGPVVGGADAVVRALVRALGPKGTLVAYTATPENSLTSPAYRAATAGMDESARQLHRLGMPAFNPLTTPCSPTVGQLSEAVRTTPGALRSSHPQTSFAAVGQQASWIVGSHPLEDHLGEESPVGRLYRAEAEALLVGIPRSLCTPFHLAEYRVARPTRKRYDCVSLDASGRRCWNTFDGVDLDDGHFPEMWEEMEGRVPFKEGFFGDADSVVVPLVPGVDAATGWLSSRITGGAGASVC